MPQKMDREITGKLFPSFPNYTDEMYLGNEPCGKGHEMLDGGFADRWSTKWGSGETYNNKILHFSINLNPKVSIFICANTLYILDIRYAGKSDFWEYNNDGNFKMPGPPCCREKSRHTLESERIERILSTGRDSCKIWDMVMSRARELYDNA